MIPQGLIGRLLLALWLAACVAVLVFAFVQRDVSDADIVFAYLMIFLTFPLGSAFAALVGGIFYVLDSMFGIVVPGGFVNNLVSWILLVMVGYIQWFVAIPWLYKKLRRLSNPALKRDALKRAP